MSDIENKNPETPQTPSVPVTQPTAENSVVSTSSEAPTTPEAVVSNNTTPTATTSAQQPIIRTPMQKRGTKISPRVFAIWCVAFIVLLVGLIFAAWYAGIQNPKALASIGMSAAQAKTLLMVVSGVFFGILFFVSFAFLGLNAYRLSKAKNTPKGKFIVGMVISLLFLTISIGVGAFAITSIQKINTEDVYSKNLVVWFVWVYTSGSTQPVFEEIEKPGITAIAPMQTYMKVNNTFRLVLATKLGVNNIISMQLSCGNGADNKPNQIITADKLLPSDGANPLSEWFDSPCFYTKKWVYNMEVIYTYFDKASQQQKTEKMPVGTINIPAEIVLTNDGVKLQTNDGGTELLGGDSPARIIFDAKKIFTDYGLRENLIVWDIDGDGIDDTKKENKSFFSNTYNDGKLYTVKYRLPGNPVYPLYYYSFPLRVLQSDVPICRLTKEDGENNSMKFTGVRPDGWTDIDTMRFEVYNITKEQVIQTVPAQSPNFVYTFPDNDQYVIRLVYTTLEKKKGFCESDIINENTASYNIKTTLFGKKPQASQYQILNASGIISVTSNSIVATEAPFDLQVRIDGISPQPPKDATITVLLDDQALQAVKSNLFTARVYGPKAQTLKVFIDDGKGNTTEKTWAVTFNQDPLRGKLTSDKATGTDPLTVQFDASTITATQPNDEIVYFSWDFGDGKSAKNVSQAKISHTYIFGALSGNGVSQPSVTVQTKQWHTATFKLDTPISVIRRATNVSITIPSHPTQVANVGDTLSLSMQTDGYVTGITWDFGDDSKWQECDFRSCGDTTHTYTEPGTYTVRATVNYQGLPSSTSTITVKIE